MNETMQIFLGVTSAFVVVLYWAICRRVSLRYRAKVADLIEAYFARDDVSDESVSAIHITYRSAQYWVFMPIMAFLSPLVLIAYLITGKGGSSGQNAEHAAILDAILKMYVSRNPLTAMLCFYFIFVANVPVMVIALMLERIRSIPNPMRIYGIAAARFAAKHHWIHHH